MSTLAETVARKYKIKDKGTARALVLERLVTVNRVAIDDPDLPIAREDERGVELTQARLANVEYGYWKMRAIQQQAEIFKPRQDVLALGLSKGELRFIKDAGADVSAIALDRSELPPGIEFMRGNPMQDHFGDKLDSIFNIIIIGIDTSVLQQIRILERNSALLMSGGLAMLRMATKGQDEAALKKTVEVLASKIGFTSQAFIKPRHSRFELWAILKHKGML